MFEEATGHIDSIPVQSIITTVKTHFMTFQIVFSVPNLQIGLIHDDEYPTIWILSNTERARINHEVNLPSSAHSANVTPEDSPDSSDEYSLSALDTVSPQCSVYMYAFLDLARAQLYKMTKKGRLGVHYHMKHQFCAWSPELFESVFNIFTPIEQGIDDTGVPWTTEPPNTLNAALWGWSIRSSS